jgi:amino acid transporter
MKNINIKAYILWLILFLSWIMIFNIMQLIQSQGILSFIKIFIQVSLLIFFINTSSIMFYKTLKISDEYMKYIYSFLNILILMFISFILISKIN